MIPLNKSLDRMTRSAVTRIEKATVGAWRSWTGRLARKALTHPSG